MGCTPGTELAWKFKTNTILKVAAASISCHLVSLVSLAPPSPSTFLLCFFYSQQKLKRKTTNVFVIQSACCICCTHYYCHGVFVPPLTLLVQQLLQSFKGEEAFLLPCDTLPCDFCCVTGELEWRMGVCVDGGVEDGSVCRWRSGVCCFFKVLLALTCYDSQPHMGRCGVFYRPVTSVLQAAHLSLLLLQMKCSAFRLRSTTRAQWRPPHCSSGTSWSCRQRAGSGPFWMPCTMQVGSFFLTIQSTSLCCVRMLRRKVIHSVASVCGSCLIVPGNVKIILKQMREISGWYQK